MSASPVPLLRTTTARLVLGSAALIVYVVGRLTFERASTANALSIEAFAALFAATLFVLAVTPGTSVRSPVLTVVVLVFCALGLCSGVMYAGCDLGMRPAIPQMVVVFYPLALFSSPFLAVGFVAICVGVAWVTGLLTSARRMSTLLILICALAASPAIALLAYASASAMGTRPQVGNCVI
jgi:hypothetical protein